MKLTVLNHPGGVKCAKGAGEPGLKDRGCFLKKSSSFVLAALRGSTYRKRVRFASSLAAASLEGLFEHPA
jgi:hypothetical protein